MEKFDAERQWALLRGNPRESHFEFGKGNLQTGSVLRIRDREIIHLLHCIAEGPEANRFMWYTCVGQTPDLNPVPVRLVFHVGEGGRLYLGALSESDWRHGSSFPIDTHTSP